MKISKPAFEIHIFLSVNDITFSIFRNLAFVFPEFASEPASGSVKQYAPNLVPAKFGNIFCFVLQFRYNVG